MTIVADKRRENNNMHINLVNGPLDGRQIVYENPKDEITLPLYIVRDNYVGNVFIDSKKAWYYETQLPKKMKNFKLFAKAIYKYNHKIIEKDGHIVEKFYEHVKTLKEQ